MRICSEDTCERPVHAKGLCNSHYNKAYYAANAEWMRARARRWHRENPEKAAATRRRRDPEALRRYSRERYWENPLRGIAATANNKARKLGAPGELTADGLAARIAYFGGLCWVCGEPGDTIDHVIAFAQGGPNVHANIRPACMSCNTTRGADLRWKGELACR